MKENQLQVQNQPTQPPPPSSRVNTGEDLHQLIEPKSKVESEHLERISMKTIIERGASWTLEETRLLLSLWGQDLVQRQATCLKRTKEVYEKISESFAQNGFVRTPDQVRTRVFNMIAEYRRILKDPNPDRRKKCIFFEPLHKIYQAKHMDDVKSALDDYEPENPYSPASNTIMSDRGDESISDSDVLLDDTLVNDGHAGSNNNNNNTNSDNANATTTNNSNSNLDGPQSNNNKNKTSATSDNNGDSINNDSNNDTTNNATHPNINKDTSEKDSASTSNHQSTSTSSSSAKKIKLESSSPKASTSQAAGDNNNKTKTYQSTGVTVGHLFSTTNLSGVKQQSLLLPHGATTASASIPTNKSTTSGSNMTPSLLNLHSNMNSTKTMPVIRTNQFLGHANGNESTTININGTPTTATRLPTTAAITGHQLYQAPVNTFDVTSSALLIDRMFSHLSRESENMRDWIALEKERIALERARRAQETEREVRRERVLIDTLMRFHESWINFIGRLDPKLVEAAAADNQLPELNIPPRESGDKQQATEQVTSQTNSTSGQTTPSQSSSAATSSTTAPAATAVVVSATTGSTSTTTTSTGSST